MRVVLSDGSGLTSRQCVTLLAGAGHEVEVLASGRWPLARWTRHVRRVHRVPAYGPDPLGWWQVALSVLARRRPQVLLATQEQVAVIALRHADLAGLGVASVVPAFTALAQVQDKLAADATLRAAGLRRPDSWVAFCRADLDDRVSGPVFLKAPIGTASVGVRRVETAQQVRAAAVEFERAGTFETGGVLVERAVAGPLVMVQAVFDTGRLVALHANHRTREGAGGGASNKTSRDVADLVGDVAALGAHLGWHGALSLDAIEAPGGPVWIDVNPRLVEPVNAARCGVDLIGPLLALARGEPAPAIPVGGQAGGRAGIRTHQLLLGVLGAAQSGHPRAGVLRELVDAAGHRGPYAGSSEELTPLARDPLAAVPVLAAGVACSIRPAWHRAFTTGAVSKYALTPAGWEQLMAAAG